jgi:hypothetical protein
MDTADYARYERSRLDDLEASQIKIAETLLFHERAADPEQGVMEWLENGNVCLRAEALLVGSWGGGRPRWRWGWANPSLGAEARAKTDSVRELRTWSTEFDNPEFFESSEQHAWGLVAIAARHLNGQGVYSATEEGVRWFFVLRGLHSLVAEDELLPRAHRHIVELLQLDEAPDEPPQWAGVDLANVPEVPDTALPPLSERPSALAWNVNALRHRFPQLRPKLANLDLRGPAQPWSSDLHAQLLVDLGYLASRKLRNLHRVDLSRAQLDGAILRGAVLTGASFDNASLVDADLSGADLRGASFVNAFLNGANLTRARLGDADLTGAELSRTILAYVDLSRVAGLDAVRHLTPSEVSFSTLVASRFQVTPTFLRKAGVSRGLLEDLARGQRFPHRYQTCFLSYSSKDRDFAEHVYASLIDAGVRVFWDRFDVVPGEYLETQIAEAIAEHDRLLVVLSADSLQSDWVKREIVLAWTQKRESLLPIRLCPIEDVKAWTRSDASLPDLAATFPVQDFSAWRDAAEYARAFKLLLRSFSGGVDIEPPVRGRAAGRRPKQRGARSRGAS